jgi:DNA-binding transcriptional regulator YiaG
LTSVTEVGKIDLGVMLMSKRKTEYRWDAASIHALREYLQMTQQEMSDELGTRQQTISEWETGMYSPRGGMNRLLTLVAERAGFDYRAVIKADAGDEAGDAES